MSNEGTQCIGQMFAQRTWWGQFLCKQQHANLQSGILLTRSPAGQRIHTFCAKKVFNNPCGDIKKKCFSIKHEQHNKHKYFSDCHMMASRNTLLMVSGEKHTNSSQESAMSDTIYTLFAPTSSFLLTRLWSVGRELLQHRTKTDAQAHCDGLNLMNVGKTCSNVLQEEKATVCRC